LDEFGGPLVATFGPFEPGIFSPTGERDRATCANLPHRIGWPWLRRAQRTGATEAGTVRRDSRRRSGGRPIPRRGYRLYDPGRDGGQALRADESGTSGGTIPKGVKTSRARGHHPAAPPQGRDGTAGPVPDRFVIAELV
jgi:hypothetical protein